MLPTAIDYSIHGQLIQSIGVGAITLLFYLLHRAAPSTAFRYWVYGWLSMLVALLSLQLVFRMRPVLDVLEFFYFFGEYVFVLFLFLGFSVFPNRVLSPTFHWQWCLAAALGWSFFLVLLDKSFFERFTLHALVFSLSMIPSWIVLYRVEMKRPYLWAKYFALLSLALLIASFMANGLSLTTGDNLNTLVANIYNAFQSVFDMLIELLLAFSLITMAAVKMQTRMARVHELLEHERDQLAMLAHRDALTDCSNRHALSAMETRIRARTGVLVMVDINDLKIINDVHGHQAGDSAIALVARLLKDCLRNNDNVFRYGGDEFLLVVFDFRRDDVLERMEKVDQRLKALCENKALGFPVTLSWGVQEFGSTHSFDDALIKADKLMYEQKKIRQESNAP